jgi:hypothetical protein
MVGNTFVWKIAVFAVIVIASPVVRAPSPDVVNDTRKAVGATPAAATPVAWPPSLIGETRKFAMRVSETVYVLGMGNGDVSAVVIKSNDTVVGDTLGFRAKESTTRMCTSVLAGKTHADPRRTTTRVVPLPETVDSALHAPATGGPEINCTAGELPSISTPMLLFNVIASLVASAPLCADGENRMSIYEGCNPETKVLGLI